MGFCIKKIKTNTFTTTRIYILCDSRPLPFLLFVVVFFKFVSVKFSSFEQLTKLNFTQIIPVPSSYKEFQIFSKGVGWNNNNEWIFSGDDVLVSVPVKPDSAIVFITVCLLICPNFIFKTFFSLWFGDFGLKFAV